MARLLLFASLAARDGADPAAGRGPVERREVEMESGLQMREALFRIQIEYVQMPQLKLTARQVQRLWNLSSEVCDAALASLIRHGFLTQSLDGRYVRHRTVRPLLELAGPLSRAS